MSDPIASLIPPTLVPSGVRDDRQTALAQTFGEALAAIDVSKLSMVDPLTVDARLLPFMIREFGAQDFIDPDLPEHVQRRFLKNIWSLKALHGYDAGVKLGLELLGMTAEVEHWWQVEPKRAANTHVVYFRSEEQLFEPGQHAYRKREIHTARRMIDRTKRTSQVTKIAFVEDFFTSAFVRTGHRIMGRESQPVTFSVPTHSYPSKATVKTGERQLMVEVSPVDPIERSAA